MALFFVVFTSVMILVWILRASKYRYYGIVSADIFFATFFLLYISLPLAFFVTLGPYDGFVAIGYYVYSLICLCLFVAPWQIAYSIRSNFLSPSAAHARSQDSLHYLMTNWPSYIAILVLSSISHLAINPSEYGLVLGGNFAIALFFVRLSRPLLILSLVLWFQRHTKSHLVSILFITFLTLPFIIISGRRSDAFFLPIAFVVAATFSGALRIPRLSIIGILAGGAFIFNVMPLIRSSSSEHLLSKYGASSLFEALTLKYTEFSSFSEAAYASLRFRISLESGLLDWLSPIFNAFSTQFVSSTVFGEDLKKAFTLFTYSFDDRCQSSQFCQAHPIGDLWWYAPTGFLEAHHMLGYAGIFLFLLVGYYVFRVSVSAENTHIASGQASPYLAVLISLSPLIVYTSISSYVLSVFVFSAVIRLSTRIRKYHPSVFRPLLPVSSADTVTLGNSP